MTFTAIIQLLKESISGTQYIQLLKESISGFLGTTLATIAVFWSSIPDNPLQANMASNEELAAVIEQLKQAMHTLLAQNGALTERVNQLSTPSARPKLRAPPSFSGPEDKDNDPATWLFSAKEYLAFHQLEDKPDGAPLLATSLKGAAATWYRSKVEAVGAFKSGSDLLDQLKAWAVPSFTNKLDDV